MASITEILTLVVILICILVLPKMFRKQEKKTSKKNNLSINSIPVLVRFGIVLSILVPAISALVFQPWKTDLILFVLTGIIPLIIGWGIYWMYAGIKIKGKNIE